MRLTRRGRLILRTLLAFATAIAVSANPQAQAPIELTQFSGEPLVLERPALRLVTLAPHLAELVYQAGAGDRLVATVAYSDFPPEAADLPRIGDAFRFDLEQILALKPDLIIAWDSGNPDSALATMDRLGLTVWRTEIRSVPDMAMLLEELGKATALPTSPVAAAVRTRWQSLKTRHADQRPLRFFYQVAERPLYTINGKHLISQGLDACGGINVFGGLPTLAPQIGQEAVIEADPELLIAGSHGDGEDPLAGWREWPRLTAVQRDALILLPADLINRPTPRMLDALEAACEHMAAHRADHGAAP